jgi:hypothetical protein
LEETEEAEAVVVEILADAILAATEVDVVVLVEVLTETPDIVRCLVPFAATAEKIARYLLGLQTVSRFIAVTVLKK